MHPLQIWSPWKTRRKIIINNYNPREFLIISTFCAFLAKIYALSGFTGSFGVGLGMLLPEYRVSHRNMHRLSYVCPSEPHIGRGSCIQPQSTVLKIPMEVRGGADSETDIVRSQNAAVAVR